MNDYRGEGSMLSFIRMVCFVTLFSRRRWFAKVRHFRKFLREDQAQDLIEYTLILAFVALSSAGLYMGSGQGVQKIWVKANTALAGGGCPSGMVQDGNDDSGAPVCSKQFLADSPTVPAP
jgi:Flp pilus assembly pilin Flp